MRSVVLILCGLTLVSTLHTGCYPDYCQYNSSTVPGSQCILTRVERDQGCAEQTFGGSSLPRTDAGKFLLSAYVKQDKLQTQRITAFNLSVTDANFQTLVTRYQNLNNKSQSACRHIELRGNRTHPPPKDLFVSCPFANSSFESASYRLQYLVTSQNYQYSRQYIFKVPLHYYIGEYRDIRVNEYTPFVYIDTSDSPLFVLYIQPYPMKYNITRYKIWVMNNDTDSARVVDIVADTSNEHIRYNFTVENGVYYVKVGGMHPECENFECANSSTPYIYIKEDTRRILIMIISTVWIPPVALYALYHAYKLYRERERWKRKKRPTCLLVYSPTRLTHINVMTELAKYLRDCQVNAMIDMLDIAESPEKDPSCWCDTAFSAAETIVVAASPSEKEAAVSNAYHNNHEYLSRLLKENAIRSRAEKRCCVVQFPYCMLDPVPEEGRDAERFSLPNDLLKLVKFLHKKRRFKRFSASKEQLMESIRLAKMDLADGDTEEIDGLLAKKISGISVSDDIKCNGTPQSFATNIDELNLLGEPEGNKTESRLYKPSTSENTFRIDQLNL